MIATMMAGVILILMGLSGLGGLVKFIPWPVTSGFTTGIAILGAIESLLSAVVADGLSNTRHDSKTELIGQGIANCLTPLLGGLPATGAIARTSANIHNGASTPIAGIVHALSLLFIIIVGARIASHIPMAAMAAVLIAVAIRMGEWHELFRILRLPKCDALVLLTTMLLTFIFDLVIAIEVGITIVLPLRH